MQPFLSRKETMMPNRLSAVLTGNFPIRHGFTRIHTVLEILIFAVLIGVNPCRTSLILADQSFSFATGKVLARITVEAGKYDRIDTPVFVALDGISYTKLALYEINSSNLTPIAKQIEPGNPPVLWWILSGTTPAHSERIYELVEGPSFVERSALILTEKNDSFLEIGTRGRKILRYNHAIVPPPQGQSELFSRSGFIHPLWSPTGDVLTNIHPPDHIHHLGIWMPWTHTKFQGKDVDFWNLKEGQGTVRFVKFLSTTGGSVYGGFQAEQDHVALKTPRESGDRLAPAQAGGEKVVLKEVWDVRVYKVGGPEDGYWLVDFKSTQRCVADSPLYQIEYRYGGFGFRAAAEWKGENAAYLTSEGKTRKDGHGTRARWCDTSGAINGKWAGITHLSHPDNFRHPEPMRIWPEFENNVFFNWAPSQLGDWVMEPGKDYIFRYRLYVHQGKVNVADSERVWQDFAEPPQVKVEAARPENAITLFDGTDFSHWRSPTASP